MNRHCLICDSIAVLPRDTAMGIAVLAGIVDGALRAVSQSAATRAGSSTPHERSLEYVFSIIPVAAAGVIDGSHAGLEASRDIAKYWFSIHTCLCLRCGATFDEQSNEEEPR